MNIIALKRRIDAMLEQIARPHFWSVVVEQGDDIPEDIRKQIQPGDTVVINEIPKGYFGEPLEEFKKGHLT